MPGKRGISADTVVRAWSPRWGPVRCWLGLQADHDLSSPRALGKAIDLIERIAA